MSMDKELEMAMRIIEAYGRRPFGAEPSTALVQAEAELYLAAVKLVTQKLTGAK